MKPCKEKGGEGTEEHLNLMIMDSQSIGNIIQNFYEKSGKISMLLEQHVVELWTEIVGEFIAKQTTKVSVKQGVIYVTIPNAALRFEVLNSRSQIISKINERIGQNIIKGIIVR